MPAPARPTRRDVVRLGLGVTAAAALAACTQGSDGNPAPTAPGGPEDPDRGLRAEVGAQETSLSALYAAAAKALPTAQATSISTLGSRHEAYRQAIDPDGLATQPPTDRPSVSGSPGATRSTSPTPPVTLPSSATGILAALRTAERDAAADRLAQSVRAADAELARLIVLAGAGAAGAAQVLAGGAS